eukprot:7041813-Pyramimonas_sp.AAC.1
MGGGAVDGGRLPALALVRARLVGDRRPRAERVACFQNKRARVAALTSHPLCQWPWRLAHFCEARLVAVARSFR